MASCRYSYYSKRGYIRTGLARNHDQWIHDPVFTYRVKGEDSAILHINYRPIGIMYAIMGTEEVLYAQAVAESGGDGL